MAYTGQDATTVTLGMLVSRNVAEVTLARHLPVESPIRARWLRAQAFYITRAFGYRAVTHGLYLFSSTHLYALTKNIPWLEQ